MRHFEPIPIFSKWKRMFLKSHFEAKRVPNVPFGKMHLGVEVEERVKYVFCAVKKILLKNKVQEFFLLLEWTTLKLESRTSFSRKCRNIWWSLKFWSSLSIEGWLEREMAAQPLLGLLESPTSPSRSLDGVRARSQIRFGESKSFSLENDCSLSPFCF